MHRGPPCKIGSKKIVEALRNIELHLKIVCALSNCLQLTSRAFCVFERFKRNHRSHNGRPACVWQRQHRQGCTLPCKANLRRSKPQARRRSDRWDPWFPTLQIFTVTLQPNYSQIAVLRFELQLMTRYSDWMFFHTVNLQPLYSY
jgi:hypothetical protein